jgi:hypothetical protein
VFTCAIADGFDLLPERLELDDREVTTAGTPVPTFARFADAKL